MVLLCGAYGQFENQEKKYFSLRECKIEILCKQCPKIRVEFIIKMDILIADSNKEFR